MQARPSPRRSVGWRHLLPATASAVESILIHFAREPFGVCTRAPGLPLLLVDLWVFAGSEG